MSFVSTGCCSHSCRFPPSPPDDRGSFLEGKAGGLQPFASVTWAATLSLNDVFAGGLGLLATEFAGPAMNVDGSYVGCS